MPSGRGHRRPRRGPRAVARREASSAPPASRSSASVSRSSPSLAARSSDGAAPARRSTAGSPISASRPGTRVTVELEVENRSRGAHVASCWWRTVYHRARDARRGWWSRASRPRGSQRVSYTVLPQTRGRYRLGPLTVDITDPFALTRQRLEFDERDELLVTPEIEDLPGGSGLRRRSELRRLARAPAVPHGRGVLHDAPATRRATTSAGSTGRSVARTGALMIRQDESSRRASGLVFLDTREQALGQTHSQAFERAVSVARHARGPAGSAAGSRCASPPPTRPAAAVTEDRFLDALAGIAHAQARTIGPALSHLRAGASADTTLVVRRRAARTRRAHLADPQRRRRSVRSSPSWSTPSTPPRCRPSARPSSRAEPPRPASR